MTNWKADPKVQEILAGFGHGEVTFGGKREGLTMQIRTATEAEIDALLEAAVAASGSTGAPPDTFRNTFRNPVAQALWGDKEKGK